jgi:transposase
LPALRYRDDHRRPFAPRDPQCDPGAGRRRGARRRVDERLAWRRSVRPPARSGGGRQDAARGRVTLYLFINKRRRIAKAQWFDGSGWCVLAKRLEAGSFQLPPFDHASPPTRLQIDGSTLAGIDFTAARQGWYRRVRKENVRKKTDTDLSV